MGKLPAFQFYPADWQSDIKLQACSLAAQGLLINLMCLMHQSERYGYLLINGGCKPAKVVAKLLRTRANTYKKLLTELLENGVLQQDDESVIYSKRMVEDQRLREIRRAAGAKGGNPNLLNQRDNQEVKQGSNQKPTPSSSSSTSSSTSNKNPPTPLKGEGAFEGEFESFWESCPLEMRRGVPKAKAKESYTKARTGKLKGQRDPATHQAIMDGLSKAKTLWDLRGSVDEFIPAAPMVTTWLNQMRWDADYNLKEQPPPEVVEKAKGNPYLAAVAGGGHE